MTTRLQSPDAIIDALVADLAPVQRRRPGLEALLLLVLAGVELALFIALRGIRADMPVAMQTPAFWWKSGSLLVIAAFAATTALASLDPAGSAQRGLRRLWILVPIAMAMGWLIDAGAIGSVAERVTMVARLDWHEGVICLVNVALLSLPPVLALGLLMRRGASVQPAATALAAGLAAAAWGAFVFAFRCDHEDPLYVVVWYGAAVTLVGIAARLLLPRLARW